MAKYPAPGRVKTRLGAVFGDAAACALYEAFVLDMAERLAALAYDATWAYSPPDAPFAELLPRARSRPQEGADLGERMARIVEAELADSAAPVLVVGADVPHVPASSLAEAAAQLAAGTDLVLGPSLDGGYYLIGLRAPARWLFEDMRWSAPDVLVVTLERAAALGLRPHLLPPTFDVDEPEDVTRLEAALARGDVNLPRTAAAIAALRGRGHSGSTVT